MNILGISCFYHDSSATLLKDGQIVYAIQEERFSRIKNDKSFPINSIKYILEKSNLKLSKIDKVVFYEKPYLKFFRILNNFLKTFPRGSFFHLMVIFDWLFNKKYSKNILFKNLIKLDSNFLIKKIYFVEHHKSHAASAFYPSKFETAVILNIDGVGEFATTSLGTGNSNNLKLDSTINFPHSLGLLYSAFTYFLGFRVNSGEYKVMGLAPYGQARFKNLILKNLIHLNEDGKFKINMKYFSYNVENKMINKNFIKLFGNPRRLPNEEITEFHMDVAASIQKVVEEVLITIVLNAKKKYPSYKNLCLAGGVALNCVANGKINDMKIFDNIWIQPAAGDAGGSLGAALYYWHNILNMPRKLENDLMKNSYLGTCFSSEEIKNTLMSKNAKFHFLSDNELASLVAKKISEGSAVGWFQDSMEFGPRALGNRSIIADPRDFEMQKNLNLKIKFRESFRPFAPAILHEHLSSWFDTKTESPYMLLVSKIKKNLTNNLEDLSNAKGFDKLATKYSKIPSVTHVDLTARVQTVKKTSNIKFYKLISEFYKLTGVPILINTSFNVRGEPIVSSPEDAFNCFMGTNLDILVCGNFILYKNEQTTDESHLKFKDSFDD